LFQIRFLEGKADATSLIPPEQLQKIFGGSINFEYDHSKYFPTLTKLCFERKQENLKRWNQFGRGKCGLDEAIIKGGRKPTSTEEDEGEVPTNEMAAVSVNDDDQDKDEEEETGGGGGGGPKSSTSTSSTSPEGTVVDDATRDTPTTTTTTEPTTPGLEKFVDAPIASEGAVQKAIPALSA